MGRRLLAGLLAIALLLSGIGSDAAYVMAADTETVDGTISNYAQLAQALKTGGIYQLSTTIDTDRPQNDEPLKVEAAVTLRGGGLSLSHAGILLGADLTLENTELTFINGAYLGIFANGHRLHLRDVRIGWDALDPFTFAAGGVLNNEYFQAAAGSKAEILLDNVSFTTSNGGSQGENANVFGGNVYNASPLTVGGQAQTIQNAGFATPADIRVSGVSGTRLTLYGRGARYTGSKPGDDQAGNNTYDKIVENVQCSTNENIHFYVENPTDFNNIDGGTGITSPSRVGATLHVSPTDTQLKTFNVKQLGGIYLDNSQCPQEEIKVSLVNDSLTGFFPGSQVNLPEKTILDISTMNYGGVDLGDFSGGGKVILGLDQMITINGNITGSTGVAIGAILGDANDVGGTVLGDHTYISAQNSKEGDFYLIPPQGENMELVLSQGTWTSTESSYAGLIEKIEDIRVTEETKTVKENEATGFNGLNITWEEEAFLCQLGYIPMKLTYNESTEYEPMEDEDGYHYYTLSMGGKEYLTEVLGESLAFTPALPIGSHSFSFVVPADYVTSNTEKSFRFTIVVQGEELPQPQDAAVPVLNTQPVSGEYVYGDTADDLRVEAESIDGGVLSYQWYKNSENSTEGGEAIEGEIRATFLPSAQQVGVTYYYCQVTNHKEEATGAKSAFVYSDIACITVKKAPGRATLTLEGWTQGEEAKEPVLTSETNDVTGAVFSYQGTLGTGESYGPTNQQPSVSGNYVVKATLPANENYEEVKVETEFTIHPAKTPDPDPENPQPQDAAVPVLNTQPVGSEYVYGNTADDLRVEAESIDGGVLSYQWYKNSENSTEGGEVIEGENEATFLPSAQQVGVTYYYCQVTNHKEEATGAKSAFVYSDIACITVKKAPGRATLTLEGWTEGEEAKAPVLTSETNDIRGAVFSYQGTLGTGESYGPTNQQPSVSGNYVAKATLPANENYEEVKVETEFTIHPAKTPDSDPENPEVPKELWIKGLKDYVYTGKNILQEELQVYHNKEKLEEKKDYTITYKNNRKAGTATIIIKGKGNYTGSISQTFNILPADISKATAPDITLPVKNKVQKGKTTITYMHEGKEVKLKEGRDYILQYPDTTPDAYKAENENPGYQVVVEGRGNYTGSTTFTQYISAKPMISKLKVGKLKTVSYEEDPLTGLPKAHRPGVRITDGGIELKENEDYTVSYSRNTMPGTAKVVITAKEGSGYIGNRTLTFKIKALPIKKATITGLAAELFYAGLPVEQKDCQLTYGFAAGEGQLGQEDYLVTYKNNEKAGTATVTFTGTGGFTGKISKTFKIKALDLAEQKQENKLQVETIDPQEYSKAGVFPEPVITLTTAMGERVLEKGKDYTLSYTNHKKPGEAGPAETAPTVIITGKGGYSGKLKETFTILPGDLSKETVTMTVGDIRYQRKPGLCKPSVVLYDSRGKKLTAGKDYNKTIVYTYKEETEIERKTGKNYHKELRGKGSMVEKADIIPQGTVLIAKVEGINYFAGSQKTAEFTYVKNLISKARIRVSPRSYTGEEILLEQEDLQVTLAGEELVLGKDYEIIGYTNNKKKGTAKVTVKGIGNYGGIKTVSFRIQAGKLQDMKLTTIWETLKTSFSMMR